MKLWDEKYRLFGIINVVDLVVVLAILVGAFAVYRVLTPKPVEGPKTVAGAEITFDVVCPSMRKSLVATSQVRIGDTIAKSPDGEAFGKVTAVRAEPVLGDAWDPATGKLVMFESNVHEDIVISVRAEGQRTTNGVVVDDVVIHSGQQIPIMTSTFECANAYLANMKIDEK